MPLPAYPRHIIALGRAYVRLIEASEHIAAGCEVDTEAARLRRQARKYKKALGRLMASQPAYVLAEVMLASERVLGPVNETGRN